MSEYVVTRKSDGAEVYRYISDATIEWNGMEFATHDHVIVVQQPVVPNGPRTMTKLEYLRRFTDKERIAIRAAAEQNAALADYLQLMELAQDINTGDPDTVAAVTMLEQAGLIALGRANEVLNG